MAKALPKISKWSARRVGASITVSGFAEDGKPVKLTRVTDISGTSEGVIATRDHGVAGIEKLILA